MTAARETAVQVAIVGGGPAGLAAALTLSRSMIRTLVIESEEPARNGASPFVASLPGLDRQKPNDVRGAIRSDISAYPYASFRRGKVEDLRKSGHVFKLILSEETVAADLVLLATGMVDQYPPLTNLHSFWGRSIINCPFCHGIEWQGARWGIFADRPEVLAAAEIYLNWSDDLVYFVGPGAGMDESRPSELLNLGIQIEPNPPQGVNGSEGALTGTLMPDGRKIDLDCLLVYPYQKVPELVARLSPTLREDGSVWVDEGYRSSIPGLYAAGDLVYQGHQNTPTALHMGNMAAASIVMDLCFGKGSSPVIPGSS